MPFRISSVPEIGVPGIKNARPTKKEAMPIRTMMRAAKETRAPRTVMRNGRRIQLPSEKGGAGRESLRREAPGTNHAHRSVPVVDVPAPPREGMVLCLHKESVRDHA